MIIPNKNQTHNPKTRKHANIYGMADRPEIVNIMNEAGQSSDIRQALLTEWSNSNDKCNVITYFANFRDPAAILDDRDKDMVESLLQKMDSSKSLDLIINSPGGLPLSAERLINVCLTYSSSFRVVVPKMAKSAATMVAFGANEILMGESAELGPVDPQLAYPGPGGFQFKSAHSIIQGVESVLERIAKLQPNQKVEGLLALMPPVDQPFIQDCKTAQDLARDIAIRNLKRTTFPKLGNDRIAKKIQLFLDPEKTHSHGRPITFAEASKIGLKVTLLPAGNPKWDLLLKIYSRTDYVASQFVKLIESQYDSFVAQG